MSNIEKESYGHFFTFDQETFPGYNLPMKTCGKCGEDLDLSRFHKDSEKPDGLRTVCKSCTLSSRKNYVRSINEGTNSPRVKKHSKNYCPKCDRNLEDIDFYSDPTTRFGQSTWCKHCRKVKIDAYVKDVPSYIRMASKHNVSKETVASTIPECKSCGEKEDLVWDHDHSCCPGKTSCGKCIRGLLCRGCNLALGYVQDSPEKLISLANYLRSF